jgi:hypothetical protein
VAAGYTLASIVETLSAGINSYSDFLDMDPNHHLYHVAVDYINSFILFLILLIYDAIYNN